MTPSTSQSAMLGALVIVILCDPNGHLEPAVASAVAHHTARLRIVRVQPLHPSTDRLYIMDHRSAIELLTGAGDHRPPVVAITDREDAYVLKEAVSAGTMCLLARSRLSDTLGTALTRIHHGLPYYDRQLLRATLHAQRAPGVAQMHRRLTTREREILAGILAGHSTRHMAEHLDISVATVRSHIHKILTKLGVHSRIQAAGLFLTEREWTSDADDIAA